MKGTRLLPSAYHESMDTAILLFLLAMIGGNEEMKRSLRSFLDFYRENRDLVAALSGKPEQGKPEQGKSERAKKDRPRGEVGATDVLEAYLNRCSG